MEKLLRGLMDFQRFQDNPRLSKLIKETEDSMKAIPFENEETLSMVAGGVGNDQTVKQKDLYHF